MILSFGVSRSCRKGLGSAKLGDSAKQRQGRMGEPYVEVNVEVATATKLSVAHLECDCHLVIAMQLLVEAFA
jgi:hypothetical protein